MTASLRRSAGLLLLALGLAAAGPAAADAALEAQVARARALVAEVARLTPEAIARLGVDDATRIASAWESLGVSLSHEVAARAQSSSGEELRQTVQAFFTTHGIEALVSEAMVERVRAIAERADDARLKDNVRGLESRYPAYADYRRRVRVSALIERLDRAVTTVEKLEAGGRPLHTLPPSVLEPARAAEGVRSVEYADGRFVVSFDARVVDGGTMEVQRIALPAGGYDWRCSGSKDMQRFLPRACRN